MNNIRDFRPDAVKMAALTNARAKVEGREPVVKLQVLCHPDILTEMLTLGRNHDEFVVLHSCNMMFIVYRDVIVAGSNYFENCLFGFFKETRTQEVHFVEKVDPDALDFYLNIAHSWFFEIKLLGIKVVPADIFKVVIEATQEEPLSTFGLQIPKLKLAKMARTVLVADYFMHRSLLCILRQMFLSLLNFTHICWELLKYDVRDWDSPLHEEIVFDYLDAFDLFTQGHDDDKLFRDAITESFYWLTLYSPSLPENYMPDMSQQFIDEWSVDRTGLSRNRRMEHAMGLFKCDQLVYASESRIQKDRRYKRILNTCPPESRGQVLYWLEDSKELRKCSDRLRQVIAAKYLEESGFTDFTPGALTHQAAGGNVGRGILQNNRGNRRGGKGKGHAKRGGHQSHPDHQSHEGQHSNEGQHSHQGQQKRRSQQQRGGQQKSRGKQPHDGHQSREGQQQRGQRHRGGRQSRGSHNQSNGNYPQPDADGPSQTAQKAAGHEDVIDNAGNSRGGHENNRRGRRGRRGHGRGRGGHGANRGGV